MVGFVSLLVIASFTDIPLTHFFFIIYHAIMGSMMLASAWIGGWFMG